MTSQTAGQGLKTKRDNKQDKWQSKTNEARRTRLLGAQAFLFVQMQMLLAKDEVNLKLKLGPRLDQTIQILVTW